MNLPLISIIVPVYNVEPYLVRCIESVLNQTSDNYELIIINDGSTDNSGSICENFVEKNNKIKFFDQKNEGVSSARNIGLENASGKYVCFLDSDDTIENDAVYELLSFIKQNKEFDIDILQFGYTTITDSRTKYKIPEAIKIYTSEEYFSTNKCSPGICGNLIKKELIGDIRFSKGIKVAEDIEFMVKIFSRANIIGSINKSLYNYLVRENSATTSFISAERAVDHLKVAVSLIEYVKNNRIVIHSERFIYNWIWHLFKGYFYAIARMNDKEEVKKALSEYSYYRRIYQSKVSINYQLKKLSIIIANFSPLLFLFILKYIRKINAK